MDNCPYFNVNEYEKLKDNLNIYRGMYYYL